MTTRTPQPHVPHQQEKGNTMSTSPAATQPAVKKHFTSSILLWVRTDQPRQTGMDYWKGPHSGIISASPGLEEYRQIHLAEHNPGLWPATAGVETSIPVDRKIDGVAEVTLHSALSPLQGRKQTQLAFHDEINVFRRTLLHRPAALVALVRRRGTRRNGRRPRWSTSAAETGPALVGSGSSSRSSSPPALARTGALKELRTQTFLPWIEKLWDTPNVAHDNPADQHFHASLILGFTNTAARDAFFTSNMIEKLSNQLTPLASAIHADDVTAALTYVKNGDILPHYQQ
jgi:hypothetical protein